MAQAPLWYTCCLGDIGGGWDLAAVPSHGGQTIVNLNASTFHLLASSQNPEAAFQVLTYLLGEASPQLLDAYGAMPARPADQAAFFAGLDAQFPQGVNWQVAIDGLAFAGNATSEGYVANSGPASERFQVLYDALFTTPGLNLDVEIGDLEADLQTILAEN
jgi:multiple sugar transport system substrate-binding protein